MKKLLQGLEQGSEVEIDLESLRATHKTILKWNTFGHDGKHGVLFKKFMSIPDRLVLHIGPPAELSK